MAAAKRRQPRDKGKAASRSDRGATLDRSATPDRAASPVEAAPRADVPARVIFLIALAILIYGAAGGPAWNEASGEAVFAAQLERSAAAPLYSAVAGALVQLLPVGEPGFRLAVGNAVLGALVLLGVIRAARALLPKAPSAGAFAAIVLALAPPFRDAAGLAGPAMLAACGAVWAIALAAAHAREPSARRAAGALACIGVTIGAAPWLGALLAILGVAWLTRAPAPDARAHRNVLVAGVAALGALAIALWTGARGQLPAASPDLTAVVAASGRGAAGVAVGAGLLGAAFGALTGLPGARWLAAAIALAGAHAIAFDHDPVALLALLAIGAAIVPGALARFASSSEDAPASPGRRARIALAAGAPLAAVALLAGPAISADDPGDSPARLANDLTADVPPGPGVFVATRTPAWFAIAYAQAIAGARPDLALAPFGRVLDVDAVEALRRGHVAAADTPAFGRLDPRRALPRGRGFQLLGELPTTGSPIAPPARYRTSIGEHVARGLALARARYEAGYLRLDLAARAAGLTDRFRAADLALLSVAAPTRARPALYGFIPPLEGAAGEPWTIDLFGDDLAWVAGLDVPAADHPAERKLHALWRRIWLGQLAASDPSVAELGPIAAAATWTMLAELAAP